MLRLAVLLLVLLNAGYWAWSSGMLADLGLSPVTQTEPQRVTAQIRPEAIRLLTPDEARRIENGRSAGSANNEIAECLQAGPFNEQQSTSLRAALDAAMPGGGWQLETVSEPARWIVYMGKYTDEEALVIKRSELRQRGVSFRPVNNEALAPGLSLGTFATQADAETELSRMASKGVRTARVVQERAELRGQVLRLTGVDAALRSKLEAAAPELQGLALQACR